MLFRRLLALGRPHWLLLIVAYICMAIFSLVTVLYAALIGPGLQMVFSGDLSALLRHSNQSIRPFWGALPEGWISTIENLQPEQALLFLPLVIVLLSLIKGVAQTGQFYIFGRVSQQVLMELRQQAFGAMLKQAPDFFVHRSQGDLLSRLTNDANEVERAFFYGLGALLRDTLAVVCLLGYVFYADAKLALITFITVPVALFPLIRFTKWMKRVSKKSQHAHASINSRAYEALAGMRIVQTFGAEAQELKKFQQAGLRYYHQMLKSYFIRAVRTPTMEVLGAVAVGGLFALLGSRVQNAGADPAHYISFLSAILFMYDPLKKLGKVSDYLAMGASAADRIYAIIDLPCPIQNAPGAQPLPAFGTGSDSKIVFDDVSFSYSNDTSGTLVLDGLSLEIPYGKVVALVGKSGAGKSTIAQLIPRFYDVKSGVITVDGHDIRGITLESLRRQISIVSQDIFLFNTTVRENIAYGRSQATEADIVKAAHAGHASEFIDQLSQGYDTVIGEQGATLSGGQRQRLAIARAILSDAPLLILDEATSHLDSDAEVLVQKALDNLLENRTALVIAHRLSTIRRADTICVLAEGRVQEMGTHQELLRAGGEYARLHHLQFQSGESPEETTASRQDMH